MPFSKNYLVQLCEVIGQGSIGNPEYNMVVKTVNGYRVEATVKSIEGSRLGYLNNQTGVAVQVNTIDGNRNIIEQVINNSQAGNWTNNFSTPQADSNRIKAGLFLRANVNIENTGFERQSEIIREHANMVERVIVKLENLL
jgi:hypothetical protein